MTVLQFLRLLAPLLSVLLGLILKLCPNMSTQKNSELTGLVFALREVLSQLSAKLSPLAPSIPKVNLLTFLTQASELDEVVIDDTKHDK